MNRKFFIAIFAFCAIAAAFVFAHGAFAQERKAAERYKIGDKGPGGGIVFYYSEEGFSVQDSDDVPPVICHYLECAPTELGETTWCSRSCGKNGGCNFNNTTDDVGGGKLNTFHIANYEHEEPLTPSNCAAYACSKYSTETTKEGEWYLPSKMELNLIYEYFQKSGKIVSNEWYWSSSEHNDYYMWCQRLSNGSDGLSRRSDSCRVLAVRAF
ncbi:MAG: DUF1566 domain-containing protein [Treponema sp.]|nr:DUF1566 domain-containing protein [Treponema sp.]